VLKRNGLLTLQAVAILAFATGCFDATGPAAAQGLNGEAAKCVTPDDEDRLADQVLQLVNLERAAEDLPPVVLNFTLSKIADDYACEMIENGFFAHRDPATGHGPGDRALLGKYSYAEIGENLAAGQKTPAEVVAVWMASPAHQAIMMDPRWIEIGIGVQFGGEHATYWVLEFGRPMSAGL
jgi:uncharacterized protein YkwD